MGLCIGCAGHNGNLLGTAIHLALAHPSRPGEILATHRTMNFSPYEFLSRTRQTFIFREEGTFIENRGHGNGSGAGLNSLNAANLGAGTMPNLPLAAS